MQALLAYIQPGIALYDLSKDGIMVTALDGKIVYTNPAIRELFGYEEDEVKGVNCANLRHDKNFRFTNLLEELSQQENIIRVIQCFGKNNRPFNVTVNYTMLHNLNNDPMGVLFTFKEKIGLPAERMEHFHHQVNLLKALSNRSEELITVTDVQARTTLYVSEALEKIIGWDNQDFVENGWALGISLTHPEDVKPVIESFLYGMNLWNTQPFVHDHQPIIYEYRWRHRNGSWRWVKSETYVLERDANDRVLYTIIFSTDITEEKNNEHHLTDKILDQLLRQNHIVPSNIAEDNHESSSFGISLSPREIEVLHYLRQGHAAKEIAVILGLRLNTINSYKKSLFKKLDARNAADAIRIAANMGLE